MRFHVFGVFFLYAFGCHPSHKIRCGIRSFTCTVTSILVLDLEAFQFMDIQPVQSYAYANWHVYSNRVIINRQRHFPD